MLASEFIEKLIYSGQQAKDQLYKEESELTFIDIQKALGWLDDVEDKLLAAKILLREELKEITNKKEMD